MHTSIALLVAITLLAAGPTVACINESGTNHRGERFTPSQVTGQHLKSLLYTPESKESLVAGTQLIVAAVRTNPSFANLNDLAAILIRHGRHRDAVALLQFIERKFPGRYETAANLGTAYELMGQNTKALKWIQEGIMRNSKSHDGTEWLHVRILKAKLRHAPKPAPGRSILDLDFGTDPMPRRPPLRIDGNTGEPISLGDLGKALRFQLLERIQFVAAPDDLIAGLLRDWANLELLAGSVESAHVLYDAALRYGSGDAQLLERRKALAISILTKAMKKKPVHTDVCEIC